MITKALIGLVVCIALAVQVNARACYESYQPLDGRFRTFDAWLAKTLPDGRADGPTHVAHVRANMDRLYEEFDVLRPARLFVKIMEAQQCNDLLEPLKQLYDSCVRLNYRKRINDVMRPHLYPLIKSCGSMFDEKVSELYNGSLEASVGPLLEKLVLDKNHWAGPIGSSLTPRPSKEFNGYIANHEYNELDEDSAYHWSQVFEALTKNDPSALSRKTGFTSLGGKFERKGGFAYPYKKYILEPCRLLTSKLGDTFMSLYVVAAQKSGFVSERSIAVKQLLYGFRRCEYLLSKDSDFVGYYFV